ncbi:MAG TPA: hypothetical protein VE664_02120 [Actinomycetes bacterium]|nr:hypothetical protein [Actinomycetes bacterium]
MPRSYLGEPTKTRLLHPGSEQLHIHHLHGGGDRWRANPQADNTDINGGLKKVPVQNAKSVPLDSQTIGPDESLGQAAAHHFAVVDHHAASLPPGRRTR